MSLPRLEEIAHRRKILGLTQKDLANMSTVSQSLIAKLESGNISPSYENVKSILDALSLMEKKESEEMLAKELYHKTIIYLNPDDTLYKAAKVMNKNKFHQLPVFQNGSPIGSITENIIVDLISAGKKDFDKILVKDVMEEPFPIVQESSPLTVVSVLLKHNPAVLITRKSKIVGLVTKADFIKSIR